MRVVLYGTGDSDMPLSLYHRKSSPVAAKIDLDFFGDLQDQELYSPNVPVYARGPPGIPERQGCEDGNPRQTSAQWTCGGSLRLCLRRRLVPQPCQSRQSSSGVERP